MCAEHLLRKHYERSTARAKTTGKDDALRHSGFGVPGSALASRFESYQAVDELEQAWSQMTGCLPRGRIRKVRRRPSSPS